MSFSLFGRRESRLMVGVDFGASAIKAVALSGEPEHPRLEAMASVATPAGSIVDHQLQDLEAVGAALKQLRQALGTRIGKVATAVTGSSVTTKIIQLPRGLSEEELESQVMLEAGQHIPFPLEDISLDYESLGPIQSRPDRENILLSAARNDSITTRLEALQMAGWQTRVVDIGVHALARAAMVLLKAEPAPPASSGMLALADIGAECLTFAVLEQGEVVHSRQQNFGGAHFTRELSQLTDTTEAQAEQAKCQRTLPEELYEQMEQQHINAILQHIRRNLQIFYSSAGSQPPVALFLSGGGSRLTGLAGVLQEELAMPVFQPDFAALLGTDEHQYPDAPAYTTALGLALRSFTPCPI